MYPRYLIRISHISVSIDCRIVPGSFPNPVVSVGVCYTAVDVAVGMLDHGMVGCCVGVLLFTSFGISYLLRLEG